MSSIEPETTALFTQYVQEFEETHPFTSFKDNIERGAAMIAASPAPPELKAIAQRLNKVSYDAFFVSQVCSWKIFHLSRSLAHAIESQNPVSLANNTRALVEHLGLLAVVTSSLDRLCNKLKGQGSMAHVQEALNKVESDLARSYYGRSPKSGITKEEQSHHINDCLDALSPHIPDIAAAYDYLCEYVHPNHGSNQLVASGDIGAGNLSPDALLLRRTIARICVYSQCAINKVKETELQISTLCLLIQDLARKCIQPGARLSSVFSERKASPIGDGRGQATAFYFPKARTPMEAIRMTYEFLESEGLALVGPKQIGAVENGWIYDIFPTPNGKLWFKTRMSDLDAY